jgi:hypothetical protein
LIFGAQEKSSPFLNYFSGVQVGMEQDGDGDGDQPLSRGGRPSRRAMPGSFGRSWRWCGQSALTLVVGETVARRRFKEHNSAAIGFRFHRVSGCGLIVVKE